MENPSGEHERERAEEGHHDRGRADERGPEVLQEQVDDQDHQDDRLEEGVDDLVDGQAHELGGVERDLVVEAVGKAGPHPLERPVDGLRHLERVGAGLLVDGDEGGGQPVEAAVDDVLPQPHLDPGHVLQADDGPLALAGAEDDVLVALGLGVRLLGDDREGQLHVPRRGLLADLPRPVEGVLAGDRLLDVGGGDPERGHAVRVHPDPHGLVGDAHDRGLAGAGHALDRVEDVDVRVVGDVLAAVALLLRVDADQHHDRRGLLLHRDALLHHGRRQLGHGEVDPVLHLHLGDVGVGVEGEVDGEGQDAGGGARRRHVEHVVDAVDLGLDGRRHRVGEGLRVGARVDGGHRHLHGRDRGVLLDRQGAHGHEAGQAQDDRDDRGEDRALDEEPGEHGARPRASR